MVVNQACESRFKNKSKNSPGLIGIIFLSGNIFPAGTSVMKLTGGKVPGHCKVEVSVFRQIK